MQLSQVIESKQRFPGGGISKHVCLLFRDGPHEVEKNIKVSSACRAVSSRDDLDDETKYMILIASREAERDFAFMKHGEQWRDHVPFGFFWNTHLTKDEYDIVESAVAMMRKINA